MRNPGANFKTMENYKIPTELENEPVEETMAYINANQNWDVNAQAYKVPDRVLLTNLAECKIYFRGVYLILEHNGIIHYHESGVNSYFHQAVDFMDLQNPKGWKSMEKLISLRQGIRQTEANLCGYVDDILRPYKITLAIYNQFMRLARAHDVAHHGEPTF